MTFAFKSDPHERRVELNDVKCCKGRRRARSAGDVDLCLALSLDDT